MSLARRLSFAYFDANREYHRKQAELQEIEDDLPSEYLAKLKSESAARGPEQFLSATFQGTT